MSVVLPASGCEMMANVRREAICSARAVLGMALLSCRAVIQKGTVPFWIIFRVRPSYCSEKCGRGREERARAGFVGNDLQNCHSCMRAEAGGHTPLNRGEEEP